MKPRILRWVLPTAIGLAAALPLLLVRYPPMADLPMHEALVATMRHLDDPRWGPPGLHHVVAPQANQLFHFIALALSYLVRTDTACKIVVAGIVGASPVLLARLLRSCRLSPLGAPLVLPVVCGWMFGWGLVPNLLGFVLLVGFLPLADTLARRGSVRDVLLTTGASSLLFFAHESTVIVFAIVLAYGLLVRSPRRWRSIVARAVPILFTGLLVAAQWRTSRELTSATMFAVGNFQGAGPLERLLDLPGAIFGGYDARGLALLGGSWAAALGAGAAGVLLARPRRSAPIRVTLWRRRYAMLAIAFLALFLFFPMALGGTTLLAYRFLPAACVCAIVACAPKTTSRPLFALALAVPLVTALVHRPRYEQAHERFNDLDEILVHLPDGAAVAQLDLTPLPASVLAPVPGAASRAQAEHGGRMLFSFTDMPPNPVYTRRELVWVEPVMRLALQPFAFVPEHDGKRFGWLLARAANVGYRPHVRKALAPEYELVATKGEWELYRSTLTTLPLDSPDEPAPPPSAEALADRIARNAAARRSK